ncbi:hypothetical protein LguiA_013095 [Lonicera macranthoides]
MGQSQDMQGVVDSRGQLITELGELDVTEESGLSSLLQSLTGSSLLLLRFFLTLLVNVVIVRKQHRHTVPKLGVKVTYEELPTNCRASLAIFCYLRLAGVPFELSHEAHSSVRPGDLPVAQETDATGNRTWELNIFAFRLFPSHLELVFLGGRLRI